MSKPAKKINVKERLTDDSLDLSLSGLEIVPIKEIVEITKARKLNLSYNSLTFLPDDFIKLQHIKEIDLSKNKLKSLPRNFGALSNLKNLDLLGNQLTDLPSSFMELKSLQWLDLKDNPLNTTLKQLAGDCLDEKQCKKCAINVMSYCKAKAVEEDRQRQIEAKKKKELQIKKEADEKEKANELKKLKKLEREQKRKENEQKNTNNHENLAHEKFNEQIEDINEKDLKVNKTSESKSSNISSLIICTTLFVLSFFTIFILATCYCRLPAKSTVELRKNEFFKSVLDILDSNVCPYTDKNSYFFDTIIKTIQNNFDL